MGFARERDKNDLKISILRVHSVHKKHASCFLFASLFTTIGLLPLNPAQAQGIAGVLPAMNLSASTTQIAQATAPPQFIPTDVTPFTVAPERNSFSPGYKFRLFQLLPERLWFNVTTEVSQRLDTNVFFTYSHPKADTAFRVLPNVTVGYNIFKNTSVYVNYFVIKDTFADHTSLNFPTTQSLSWGIQHNVAFSRQTNLQFNMQARELWQTSNLHQFDFIPGMTLTHVMTPNNIVFASTLLQLRGGQYFVAPTREIDPFYTLGYIHRQGSWTFIVNDTLVTNFRNPPFNDAIPRQSNMSMIADIELNRPVSKKFPALLTFVRAEPIWNWDSKKTAGISGFDFRLYGGLRLTMSKPSYYGAMDDLRKQIMQSEQETTNSPVTAPASTIPAPGKAGSRNQNGNGNSGNTNGGSTISTPNNNSQNGPSGAQPIRGI